MRRGKKAKARSGKVLPSRAAPYGFAHREDPDQGSVLVVDEADLRAQGVPHGRRGADHLRAVRQAFDEGGVPTSRTRLRPRAKPSPVVPSNSSLASAAYSSGTKISLGPAGRKSGTSKPLPLCTSTGMPTSSSSPFIKTAKVSFGADATLTHVSSTAQLLQVEV